MAGTKASNNKPADSGAINSETMDALSKLSDEQRSLACQHMLQTLLADHCPLVVGRGTKELRVYSLTLDRGESGLRKAGRHLCE
jgi:uncharacterized protein (TIGR03435 family)